MNGTVRCVAWNGPGGFEVTLPLTVVEGVDTVRQPERAQSGLQVLVVDDTAVVRAVAEDMLKICGCSVTTVAQGPRR